MSSNPDVIRFLLNGEVQVVSASAAKTTLLDYVRDQRRLTGTKEGCGEGDCGACTVLMISLDNNAVHHRTVNACITLLGSVHGRAVVTIEGLSDPGTDSLHPIQQALVDTHASQCGFCSPGMVMSLAGFFMGEPNAITDDLGYALAGNLCRCTGYRPILAAANNLRASGYRCHLPEKLVQTDALKRFARAVPRTSSEHFVRPTDRHQLDLALERHPDADLIAGGTDVVPSAHTAGTIGAGPLIWVDGVTELRSITSTLNHVHIGAAVTLAETLRVLAGEYPEFREIARRFASPSITSAGTLGGNIANASSVADLAVVLMSLNTNLVLRCDGVERTVPIEAFYCKDRGTVLEHHEYIDTVRIGKRVADQYVGAYKVAKRFDQDIATLLGAFSMRFRDGDVVEARISFGGIDAVPRRASLAENTLIGQPWGLESLEEAINTIDHEFSPISDLRGSRHYRITVAGNLLRKFFIATKSEVPTSLWQEHAP